MNKVSHPQWVAILKAGIAPANAAYTDSVFILPSKAFLLTLTHELNNALQFGKC